MKTTLSRIFNQKLQFIIFSFHIISKLMNAQRGFLKIFEC